jgi:DNA-binding beta-propeller fold protein YncE
MSVEVKFADDLKLLCQTTAKITTTTELETTISGEGLESAEVGRVSEFLVAANGWPVERLHTHLKRLSCDSITECKVDNIGSGKYRIQYTPTVRGHHELIVTMNGLAVPGSPFPVFVSIPPTQLGKPVGSISTGDDHPVDVAVNSVGEIIVATEEKLLLFNRKRERVSIFKSRELVGVTVDDANNNVYALSKELMVLSPELKLLQQCEVHRNVHTLFLGVAIVGDEVMACDRVNNCIMVYTKELEFLRDIGQGTIKNIHDVSSDKEGNIYVSDYGKRCILVFNNGGDFLQSFNVQYPISVSVAGEHVYVTSNDHKVSLLHCTTGQQVTSFGKGLFLGVCTDKNGFVYACDYQAHEIVIF